MASHNEGFMYSHTVHSRCFLFLWAPVLHSSFTTFGWHWKRCEQFFGSHQFSVTLSTKDFSHHSVLVFAFFFNVSSRIMYHGS